MRTLLLLRGSAGCGKSTYIEENGLKPYTLSADDIRLLCQSPLLQADGSFGISQQNEKIVWKTLFQLLETRMQRGEFTVIDATNSKTVEMNRYKDMAETYRYRIYCVDFTDIPIEETKRRNASRTQLKQVPDEVIDKMYSRFATQKIPSGITVLKPDELNQIWLKPIDLSEYNKIHHIGDIHGCYTALKEYIDSSGGIKDDEFYIFTGDYIDRGIENAEVVNFLYSIMNKKNIKLLEGNHERWLWNWGNDCRSQSKEFELVTRIELENNKVSKKDMRCLYRKLIQCSYYTYYGKTFLVTHAGLSCIPDNLLTVATEQMIKGVGNYNDFEVIAKSFTNLTDNNCYQIHGHRNTKQAPIQITDRNFNLEGQIEFGGSLRCVQITKDAIKCIETKNTVFKVQEKEEGVAPITESSIGDLIIEMRNNKYIQEKRFGNISSFNFSNKAFFDKVWDSQTTKARGLYLDTVKRRVVARAYEKFFNINERPETKFDMLQHKLSFPVTAYVKENGFLGIVSYDEYNDDLFITTKSTPDGEFAKWFKELLSEKYNMDTLDGIKQYSKDNSVSFVFECVDMKHDPHIIKYPESKVILLDIVINDMNCNKYEYDRLTNIANNLGLEVKRKAYELANWQDFYDWYYDVNAEDYEYEGNVIEGFVIEDSVGFMTKIKLSYYKFWKFMRSVSHEAIRKGYITKTSALVNQLANEYYGWVRTLNSIEDKDIIPKDICTLRDMFYEYKAK
jgi:predicted kinase